LYYESVCAKENARLISSALKKEIVGNTETLYGGKVELMSRRKSVHICCLNIGNSVQLSSEPKKEQNGSSVTLCDG